MQTRVRTVSAEESLLELERFLLAENLSGAPVTDGGKLVGVVSRSDVLRQLIVERAESEYAADYELAWGMLGGEERDVERWITDTAAEQLAGLKVKDAMIHDVKTVSPDTPVEDVARLMIDKGIHRVIVTDGGELAGIVTSMDLVRLFADGKATIPA